MIFADIHNHALFNVDDGPKTEKDMYALIDAIYKDNIRYLCVTPHYHPGYFGENSKKSASSYKVLLDYAKDKYPDMFICSGNELRYERGCVGWIEEGKCNPINGTNYVLMDFSENESMAEIVKGTNAILNFGYVPILAHVERYRKLSGKLEIVQELKENGVIIQIDAQSILGSFGFGSKRRCKKILDMRLADVAATDAHGSTRRPPSLTDTYSYIEKHYGERYARALCIDNPLAIIENRYNGKE